MCSTQSFSRWFGGVLPGHILFAVALLALTFPVGAIPGQNDAPVLNNSKSPVLNAEYENFGPPSGAVGTLVSRLVDFAEPLGQVDNVTDADNSDGDSPAVLGIAITAADTANGSWYYSVNGASWTALGTPSAAASRLLAANAITRLYFLPNASFSGTISSAITFRVWDQTSGTSGSTASTSVNGSTTAFSTATDTAAVTVMPDITFRSTATAKSGSATTSIMTIAKPTGTLQGDVMIAGITTTSISTITPPVGWALIRRTDNGSVSFATYWKAASGSEGSSYTWTFSSASACAGGIATFIGVSTTSPTDVENGNSTTSSTTHVAPSLTPTLPRTMLLTWHAYASSGTWTPPIDMTEAIDVMSENTTGSGGVSLECNYIFEPSSAATGTKAATASNNADVGAVESIALRPVNIAPVLDATKSPVLAAENQDADAPIGAAGTLVSTLADLVGDVSGLDNVTDNDADGVAGIAITGADTVNGSWFYTSNSITWNSLPSVSDANALLLQCDAGNRLYFQPNTNFSGPISNAITFRAWDRTSGANLTLIPITTTGGNSAFSTASDTASITINAIAVAPLLLTPTLNSNHFQFTLTGTTGSLYVIDFSTNLSNTNWTSIQTSTAPILFTEPATNGHRFYRGKTAP